MQLPCACFMLAVLSLLAGSARAEPDDARYQAFDLAMARDYLLPRYQSLEQATDKQEQSWAAFCRQPTADGFSTVRSAFQDAMDAWMPLQHVHTGPAALQTRIDRIHFWPERKNAVAKQLAALLQSGDAAALAPDRLATASVAVQGFPALQLLLYDGDDPARLFLSGDQAAAYRCAYGTAVARNLKAIAGQIVEGWTAAVGAMAAGPARSGSEYGLPASPKETAQQMFTDLLTLFQLVGDLKLALPLGPSLDKPKPKLAENWRSGRSLRNVELNLESARAMYGKDRTSGFRSLMPAGSDGDDLDEQIVDAFAEASSSLAAIPMPLDAAVGDSSGRPEVEALLADVRRVRDLVGQQLPSAIGLSVGFNALDGD
ncbi:MAG: imelysin family protein [Dongiaceae bacterium]